MEGQAASEAEMTEPLAGVSLPRQFINCSRPGSAGAPLLAAAARGVRLTNPDFPCCRQVGCPESGIEEAVQRLTAAGYKVGRVEQTETAAEAKKKRGNKVVS